jgi:hypothetical protein
MRRAILRAILILAIVTAGLLGARSDVALAQSAVMRLGPPSKYVDIDSPSFQVEVWVKNVYTTNPCEPYSSSEACGLGAYEFEVHFDPTVIQYVSVANGPFLTSTGRAVWSCFSRTSGDPPPHDPANGRIHYTCNTTGNPPGGPTPFGPEGSGHVATITFAPLVTGTTSVDLVNTILAETPGTAISHTDQNGTVTVGDYDPTDDTDGDGCADTEEAGDNPLQGGDRNPYDQWDFYDVPVPANPDPIPNGPKNQAVSLTDALAILLYVGASDGGPINGNGVDYDSDKNQDGVDDGRDYDRTPSWPFSGAPNGAINLGDVLAALAQGGHHCAGPS